MFDVGEGNGIPDQLDTELAALAGVETETFGTPLHAVALLAVLAADLDPVREDVLAVRRRRLAGRRLAAHAAMAAACVLGAFGDRPDLSAARGRVFAGLGERIRRPVPSPPRALGAVAAAVLALPAIEDDGQADWQLGAIAFVDEALLRALAAACVDLAAAALVQATG